ncbi:hypothetical protein [Aliarcobacter cryaerophilus]|uniref:hypothetical protein n=1 Tax=Aliarcobacter cryaerophilus TaxID=28198 RepID=UPI001D17F6D5|nr:hypothetical protein [Aliarcobacter cryaerophilus]
MGKAIFRDTIVSGKFDLRNSIFDAEANFLDITSKSRKKYDEITNDYKFIGEPTDINVANRETARIIKNFYDNSNNIIEANRFYKLEMKKRMEEYNSLKKSDYRTFERLIFILHEWSSNHSQNWFLPFFWIVSLTFGYSLFACDFTNNSINNKIILDLIELTFDTTGVVTITFIINCIILAYLSYLILEKDNVIIHPILIYLLVSFYMLYVYFSSDLYLKSFANSLNPFSLMTGSEKITILGLCYKIAIAYLIYQLIVSIRQNTRRK